MSFLRIQVTVFCYYNMADNCYLKRYWWLVKLWYVWHLNVLICWQLEDISYSATTAYKENLPITTFTWGLSERLRISFTRGSYQKLHEEKTKHITSKQMIYLQNQSILSTIRKLTIVKFYIICFLNVAIQVLCAEFSCCLLCDMCSYIT